MKKLIGKRKFLMYLYTLAAFYIVLIILAIISDGFKLDAVTIGAIGGATFSFVSSIIYGYAKEYKSNENEIKDLDL